MDATHKCKRRLEPGDGMWDGPHWMLEFGYNGVFAGDGIIDWQTRILYLSSFASLLC